MGRGRVRKRAAAIADLVEHSEYRRDVASRETATRFLAAAERAFALLAAMPTMGKPWHSALPEAADVRVLPVRRFPTHLVFYVPLAKPRGVEVLRVLHTARDLRRILEGDPGE